MFIKKCKNRYKRNKLTFKKSVVIGEEYRIYNYYGFYLGYITQYTFYKKTKFIPNDNAQFIKDDLETIFLFMKNEMK